jgi:CRP-like cAMP-binding protein
LPHPLLLNLGQHDSIPESEAQQLMGVLNREKTVAAGDDIVSVGSRPTNSCLLMDGFAARYKIMADGGRQITAIQIAGDFVDLHGFLLKTMDHGIVALSACRLALAEHEAIRAITETSPHLTRLLWLDTLVEGAIHREWTVAMGRRSAKARLAHLVCELFVRLHLNRTLQDLRRLGVISWSGQKVTIEDWNRLSEIAEFDPTYLSLQNEPR